MKTSPSSCSRLGLVPWLAAFAVIALSSPLAGPASTPAQQAYVKASNTGENDFFGYSVAVSVNTMVVGAYEEDSNATGVNGTQNNNSAVDSGAAYIFVRTGTNWTQQAYLKGSNTGAGDYFGYSVAISGDTVVIGAPFEDSNATGTNGNQSNNNASDSGAAYVFVRNGTTWSQQAYLKASNTGPGDAFGAAVSISGNTVVIGAAEDSDATGINGDQSNDNAPDSGAAYVFVRSGTTWSQQAYLKASNAEANDRFGGGRGLYFAPLAGAVAVSGDTIVVGAFGESSNATGVNGNQSDNSLLLAGAAYVFVRSGTNWSQQAYLKASNTSAGQTGLGSFFGYSLSLSGDTLAVASPAESSSATGVNGNQSNIDAPHSGAAFIFVHNGTNWSQQAYLKASNTESDFFMGPGDAFGYTVAVSGDTVLVGTPIEDSNATGINGNQSNNSAGQSGAAYAFVRNGTNWSQQAYLKASNTGGGDGFGYSVAVSGDTMVSGALGESRSGTGVNGNQLSCCVFGSGAAYVFVGLGFGPTLAITADGTSGYFLRFAGHAGFTYRLLRAPSVTGPWSSIATNTAPASGLVEFHDASPLSSQAFYRALTP